MTKSNAKTTDAQMSTFACALRVDEAVHALLDSEAWASGNVDRIEAEMVDLSYEFDADLEELRCEVAANWPDMVRTAA